MANPLEQFEIKPIVPVKVGSLDLSFTNSSLFMFVTVAVVMALMIYSTRRVALVPGRWQAVGEMLYEVIANMIRDNVGKEGRQYFPFVFTLFMFVLFCNLIGMIPGTFTVTSHISVTFGLAIVIFIGVTVLGFVRHGTGYFGMFFPHGAPAWTAVILIPIELISYLSRPISLSLRLFANMTAGHLMLKVIAGFVPALGIFGVIPFGGLVVITGFEFMIAVIQAYVFTILTCIYLHDAIHMH